MFDLNEPAYSVSETAKIIGVDRSTIYRLIRDKQIETTYDSPIKIKQNDIKIYILKNLYYGPRIINYNLVWCDEYLL